MLGKVFKLCLFHKKKTIKFLFISGFDEPRAFQIIVGTDSWDNASASHSVILSYMYPLYANDNEVKFIFNFFLLKSN